MSTQEQQQQQQQPSLFVYPNSPVFVNHPPPSHSNGSFGMVFVVLAVIVTLSAISCCLGRICSKGKTKQKPLNGKDKPKFRNGEKNGGHVKEEDFDLEFGFEKGLPTLRSGPVRNGDGRGFKPPGSFRNGDYKNSNGKGQAKVVSFNPVVDIGTPPLDRL